MSAPRPVSWRVTCLACPWQVEGQLEDGRWFYLRHRSCSMQLGVGRTLEEAVLETLLPETHLTYHENNASECPGRGYCSGVEGEEAAFVWQLVWRARLSGARRMPMPPLQLPRQRLPQR